MGLSDLQLRKMCGCGLLLGVASASLYRNIYIADIALVEI
jgi:hypothetical protein